MEDMARKAALVLGLALALTCGPTAVPTSESGSPSASPAAIATADVITLREGGQGSILAVRKVATSELVRQLPDGLLLPDGVTLVSVEGGIAKTLLRKIDRRTGATTASQEVAGAWQLPQSFPSFTGASVDGSHLVLFGSSYNFTDQSGTWTARTTFGVLDVATWRVDPVELDGRYTFQAVSDDGRLVYVTEYSPPQLPASARLRVYDTKAHVLGDVAGDATSSFDGVQTSYVGGSAFQLISTTETLQPSPGVIQVRPATRIAKLDLASKTVQTLRLPIERALNGEEALAWSIVASRDGRTAYAVNPAAAVVYEIDVASLQIRRTASLGGTQSGRDALGAVLAFLHPIAEAKMGFGSGAVLSPDGLTLYVLGVQGVWSVDLANLKARVLTHDGAYETMKVSPDGKRLYLLGREDGVVSAIDADNGKLLGSMKRFAFPSEIVAVDAG